MKFEDLLMTMFITSSFFLFSCTFTGSTQKKSEFQIFVENLPEREIKELKYIDKDHEYVSKPHRMLVDSYGQMIVVDSEIWEIHLFSAEGEYLTTVGGVGSGPGEFSQINHISLSEENMLHVLDLNMQIVTSYKVQHGNMVLYETMKLQNYMPLWLEQFYESPTQGYLGMFRNFDRNVGKEGMNDTYMFYTLGENLQPKDKIAEVPGSETIKMGESGFVDENGWGITTKIHYRPEEDILYYAQTDEIAYSGKAFDSQKEVYGKAKEYPEFKLTASGYDYLYNNFSFMFETIPEMGELLENLNTLPYFTSLHVTDSAIYWDLFETGWDSLYILGLDRQTEELFTIKVPSISENGSTIDIEDVVQNKIYGSEYSDVEGNTLFVVEIE
jgi:hypothetical protein